VLQPPFRVALPVLGIERHNGARTLRMKYKIPAANSTKHHGSLLNVAFRDACTELHNRLTTLIAISPAFASSVKRKMTIPNLDLEIQAFLYTAFILAMDNSEAMVDIDAIRNEFFSYDPFPEELNAIMIERSQEYIAIRKTILDRGLDLHWLGEVFGTHILHAEDDAIIELSVDRFEQMHHLVGQYLADIDSKSDSRSGPLK